MTRPIAVILPAAGSGARFGGERNKLLANLAGKPIWRHSVDRFLSFAGVVTILMPVSPSDRSYFSSITGSLDRVELVDGGATRTDSVRRGLERLRAGKFTGLVAVHDAARPLVDDQQLHRVFAEAQRSGAAILAVPVTSTLKRGMDQTIASTVDRSELWEAQTPQVFDMTLLLDAYDNHAQTPATDDAELVQRTGHPVRLVEGCRTNLKITVPGDLMLAEAIIHHRNHS